MTKHADKVLPGEWKAEAGATNKTDLPLNARAEMKASCAVIGGARSLMIAAQYFRDPVGCAERLYNRYGAAVKIRAPFSSSKGRDQFLFVGPEYNRDVLVNHTNFRPSGAWPVPGKVGSSLQNLRRNLLCMPGPEHDLYINPVYPLLSRAKVQDYFDGSKAIAAAEIGAWPVDHEFDLTTCARRLSQHYAFALLFGERDEREIERFSNLLDEFHQNTWSPEAFFFRADAPFTAYRRLLRSAEALEAYIFKWCDLEKGCPADKNLRSAAHVTQPDGAETPREVIAANIALLATASYETSANTLSWMLFMLSQHPKIAAALAAEIDCVGDIARVDCETLTGLPLLDGVLKETMRLFAPAPLLGFEALTDCEVVGVGVRRHERLYLAPHLTHRLLAIYERPREFRPERWAHIRPSTYEYLPFSAGARRCPGLWFASNNLKIALATIVSRYRVNVAPGSRIDRGYAVTTVPRGMRMRLIPRNGRYERTPCRGNVFNFFDLREDA